MRRYISSQLAYAYSFASEPPADANAAPPPHPDPASTAPPPPSDAPHFNAPHLNAPDDMPPMSHNSNASAPPADPDSQHHPRHHHRAASVRKYLFSTPSAPTHSTANESPSARRRTASVPLDPVHDAGTENETDTDTDTDSGKNADLTGRARPVSTDTTTTTTTTTTSTTTTGTASSSDADALPTRRQADCPGLRELIPLADKALGPVGHPRAPHAKRVQHDRMLATLNASAHDRNRLLMQFLRARSHNASEALAMLTNSLRWRSTMDMHSFLRDPTHDAAKFPACFPMHIVSTPQNAKQPVVYGLIRLLDRKAERVPFQNALLSFLESSYYGAQYVDDEMIIILDFRDWSIRRNAPYRLVKDGLQILQDYYPERLGRVFLLNYPTSIRAAYTVISPVIDPGAKEKIVWIPDADPSVTLGKYLTPKSIPSFLGGTLQAQFPPGWPDIDGEFAAARASHK